MAEVVETMGLGGLDLMNSLCFVSFFIVGNSALRLEVLDRFSPPLGSLPKPSFTSIRLLLRSLLSDEILLIERAAALELLDDEDDEIDLTGEFWRSARGFYLLEDRF